MPKITIKEIDNTKAGIAGYANFTVAVPGLVAIGSWKDKSGKTHLYGNDENDKDVFDENGIYECSSQADFKKYIGQVAADEMIITKAVHPSLASWDNYIDDSDSGSDSDEDTEPRQVSPETFEAAFYDETVVVCVAEERPGINTDFGYYFDEKYIYTAVERIDDYDPETYYALLVKGHEGVREEKGAHYGNQIAYELLGLGYTILYKKFSEKDSLGDYNFWAPLRDKATYDFRYVINGLLNGNMAANEAIVKLAHYENPVEGKEEKDDNGRGDCVALIDVDADVYKNLTTATAIEGIKNELGKMPTSKYAAIFAPYVVYNMKADEYGDNTTFPAAFHYLACAARAAENYNEWYAIAGYTRGISNYSIIQTGVKLGDSAVEIFEPRYIKNGVEKAINLIVKIKNSYYLWGNRTSFGLGDPEGTEGDLRASHFLNIRQLCSTIKKQVYVACRRFTFDPNSDILWGNFCNAIRPTLEKMKADQGIKDYKFIKVATTQKAVLKAKIRIVPIEAVEDFDISLYLEDSLGNVAADIEEE